MLATLVTFLSMLALPTGLASVQNQELTGLERLKLSMQCLTSYLSMVVLSQVIAVKLVV